MEIRPMTTADYNEIYSLWRSCPGMGLNDIDDSKTGFKRFLDRNPNTCFTATETGKITGCIMAGHDGRRGYIYHTAVDTVQRRKGIASALLNAAMDALENEGISKVALVVFDRNKTGNAFWESKGFTVRDDLVYRNIALKSLIRIDVT